MAQTASLNSVVAEPRGAAASPELPNRDVFILGAGFSKAVSRQMPLMDDLGKEVRKRLKKTEGFASAIPKALGNNFELWMTYLAQPHPWLTSANIDLHRSLGGRIRLCIAQVIEERTALANPSQTLDWLVPLLRSWHERQAVVITLNYDTLVERAARHVKVPDIASCREYPLVLDDIYAPYFVDIASRTGAALFGHKVIPSFRLLKLHGSVNWHYSGRESFYGETIYWSDVSELGQAHDADAKRRGEMAGDKYPLIIPPVAEKTAYFNSETVRGLWKDAASAVREATALYIIGYSLPDSDLGMRFFLANTIPENKIPVHIANTDMNVVESYRKHLPGLTLCDGYVQRNRPVVRFARDYPDKI